MQLIDTHAHLASGKVAANVEGIVQRAADAGVGTIVSIATGPEDWDADLALAERFPGVYATAGIHPHAASQASDEAFARMRTLLAHPRVVGVGETGLDYHYDFSPRDAQRDNFARHLEISRETGKPLLVHNRTSDEDLRALLREAGQGTMGVLHSFSSSRALLEEALAMGWYASFSGMVTFRNFEGADFVRMVPADRIMVETDTPYLAPVPHRGKTNEPAFVTHVAARCAELRGEDPAGFAARTTENARRFYGI
ncbi:TatD family hydrolase [Longimicrobium sp.]|uniref:TatD family hydrolase n=1 Tax=Longimicrobium sp. TaxID=2029185 RepID=UPI002E2F8B49|nr:TatD family hydrolase [Longimicrobium sp.]HEX6037021.1 TatD family hydrolase [Longimicrobium sp.]